CDYLSRQWVEYTGIPEAEQLGLRWLNLVLHLEDREQTYRAWMTAVHDREPYDLEYRLRRRDGMYRWFRTRGTPLRNAEGKIQKWFGTCTDIDDAKRAAEERQELLAREREARRTAELLNQVGPLLAAELDTQQLAQKITDLATQLTGAQFGALFHNVRNEQGESYTLYTLSGVPREAFANFPMPRNTMIFGPTFRGEGVIRSADITQDARYGKNRPYRGMPEGHLPVRSYLAAPIVSRSGEVLGGLFFGSATVDVFTEQHAQLAEGIAAQAAIALDNARLFAETQNARNALEQSNAELRRANEDLNQFAYSASHDLKEPLRTVAIYSQMLQRQYGAVLDEQATQYLEYALQGVKRMELLLRDLVAYLQAMDEGEQEIVPVPGGEVFRKAVENLKDIIEESQATVDSGPLPVLLAREVHLLQLFQNLLGNALKYRGEAPPHIQVSAESQEGMWKISVRDNGIGIEPQYARQVFGLFKRLHGRNSGYEGTGIGLAICQKIVERYGGRIWVESEGAGQGSTFCFTLPGRPNA
ncbi:MAG: PAS domain-containing protein, partial [Acidobacteriaceae bacterium]|nr:PAS domain-containing protein [Acidobacteriaceae bacterium]